MLFSYVSSTWHPASVFRQKSVGVGRMGLPGRQRTQVTQMHHILLPNPGLLMESRLVMGEWLRTLQRAAPWPNILGLGATKMLIFTKCIIITIQSMPLCGNSTMNQLYRKGLSLCSFLNTGERLWQYDCLSNCGVFS